MIIYSVEIYPRVHDRKRQRTVKWVDLYNASRLSFLSKREAFKFARLFDFSTWRVFVVVHGLDDQKFGKRKLIEVRK